MTTAISDGLRYTPRKDHEPRPELFRKWILISAAALLPCSAGIGQEISKAPASASSSGADFEEGCCANHRQKFEVRPVDVYGPLRNGVGTDRHYSEGALGPQPQFSSRP